jgi:hypothetical protein
LHLSTISSWARRQGKKTGYWLAKGEDKGGFPMTLSDVDRKALDWLLEPENPGVRYLAMRDLLGLPEGDPELAQARQQAHSQGPAATILDAMDKDGYWVEPGPGYHPKYTGTVWSVISLAQLGASASADERVETACSYLLEHALTPSGQFTVNGAPSYTIDCLQGNLCAAMLDLGVDDPRLPGAFDWMARTVTGEGVAPLEDKKAAVRYYGAKCGPLFACGANNQQPCAWGGAKVMLAFSKLAPAQRTPLIERAIQAGVDFFLGVDPATAGYPNGWAEKPSQNWWKFGFPVFYITDLLQVVEALVGLGHASDPRLAHALKLVRQKQCPDGSWALEYDYGGKIWVDLGIKKQPNKWVTLRALRALKND